VYFGPDTTQTLVVSASETARDADCTGDSYRPGETARFVRETRLAMAGIEDEFEDDCD
jgi:hypothetical protein